MTNFYSESGKMGKKGAFTVPAPLRRRFGLSDGAMVIAVEREDGILLRPAVATPIEVYSKERVAEFLLSNAVDAADYKAARAEVMAMGLSPDSIAHYRP